MAPTQCGADLQKAGNLREVQLFLGHTKMDSTVMYSGVSDVSAISEGVEI